MKLSTIAEALASQVDEPVLAIRGKLTKLFKLITGEGQYGAWSLQNGELMDATGKIKVVFSNRNVVPDDWRNQTIEIRCTKGQKGGWSGAKRSEDKKNKVATLHVTAAAEMFLFGQEHEPEPETGEPAQSAPPNSPTEAPSKPQDASRGAAKGNTAERREKGAAELMAEGAASIYQILNTQYAVIAAIEEYLVPIVKERGVTLDQQQKAALIQNCLIQCFYDKVHWKFPGKRFPVKPANLPADQDGHDAHG